MGRSKNDAEARTVYLTPASEVALEAMRPAGADGSASLFGLSAPSIARRIRAAAAAAGPGSGFSGHSGRVGMARRMAAAGAPNARDHGTGALEDGEDGRGLYAGGGSGTRRQVAGVTTGPVPYNTVCVPSEVRVPLD